MKILVFSDSHGDREIIDYSINHFKPDRIFALGDYGLSLYELEEIGLLGVRGNSYSDPEYPLDRIIDINGIKFLLTHGHTHRVRETLNSLYYLSKENNVKICLYGHTHYAKVDVNDDIYFINPGSIGNPYVPMFPTLLILEIDGKEINARIYDASTFEIYKEVKII